MLEKRLFYLIIDQLPGHWAEGIYVNEEKKIPPVNVLDYHERRLIPHFSELIRTGIWVKRPWNRGVCKTGYGLKYLSTGTYDTRVDVGFFEYLKKRYEKIKVATFLTLPWGSKGYLYVPDYMVSLPPYYPDDLMWRNFIEPYLKDHSDWDVVCVYFPTNDQVLLCPSYQEKNAHPKTSKHAYMLYLDKLLGEIVKLLKCEGYWKDTIFVIASDHGYHLGCEVCYKEGARTVNFVYDHIEPFDCYVWNFKENRKTEKYSGGPRRVTFIVSGGGLEDYLRGTIVEEAEIIDVVPTITRLLNIPYKCEGKSIV